MQGAWFGMTRRRALTFLLLLLLLAPIPLTRISGMLADPQHPALAKSDAGFWLFVMVVLMGSAIRGDRSALGLWAVLSAAIGAALVIWNFSAHDGSVRLLGGLIALAASLVFALLRDELGTRSRDDVRSRTARAA